MKKIILGLLVLGSFSVFADEDIYSVLKDVRGQSVFKLEGKLRSIVYDCGAQIFDDMKEMKALVQMRGGNKFEKFLQPSGKIMGWSKSYGSTWDDIEAIFGNSRLPEYYKVKWDASTDTYYGEITRIYDQNCKYVSPEQEEILDFSEKWNSKN
ncbi:MAG: hypothetical protein ACOYL6_16585 [Bacteriovoracaceae bacterium]